jgi:hypothetical protein
VDDNVAPSGTVSARAMKIDRQVTAASGSTERCDKTKETSVTGTRTHAAGPGVPCPWVMHGGFARRKPNP